VVLASGLLFIAGGRWPLTVAVAQSLIIAAAHQWADATPVTIKILASVALFELAVRRPLREVLLPIVVMAVVYFAVLDYDNTLPDILAVIYKLIAVAAAPVLLGAYLRSSAAAVRQALARAADAEERRELAGRSARLAERTEIARELHDLVAHHVASMALRVGVARAVVPDLDPEVSTVLDDVHNSATTTLADLRRLVSVLRDPSAIQDDADSVLVEPTELPTALRAVIDRSVRAGLAVDPHIDPRICTLDSVGGLAVLRLVQESLTNVAKHAGVGARTHVRVDVIDSRVQVEVVDNGVAVDSTGSRPPAEPGYGLIGLRERIELVGGTLSAGPYGRGWRVHAALPAQTNDNVGSLQARPAVRRA
jgi:signal transduction histidine kinase